MADEDMSTAVESEEEEDDDNGGGVEDEEEVMDTAPAREASPDPPVSFPRKKLKANRIVDDDDDGDVDDPVVADIPVFLSKGAENENLYLFQYPVRPASMPYPPEAFQGERA